MGTPYTIQQLATHARVSVETVRYYIRKGAVPKPLGSRRHPIYTDAHLRALMHVRGELEANARVCDVPERRRPPAHTVRRP